MSRKRSSRSAEAEAEANRSVEPEELDAPRCLRDEARVEQRRAVELVEHVQAVVQTLDRQPLRAEARPLERIHRHLHLLHPPAPIARHLFFFELYCTVYLL